MSSFALCARPVKDGDEVEEGGARKRARVEPSAGSVSQFEHLELLPNHILLEVLSSLDIIDLAKTMCTSHRLQQLAADEQMWEAMYANHFGEASSLQQSAVMLAGGWRAFCVEKFSHDKGYKADAASVKKPSFHEKKSACMRLTPPGEGTKVVLFLLDGSGSVSDDEFTTMTDFVLEASGVVHESVSLPLRLRQFPFLYETVLSHAPTHRCRGIACTRMWRHASCRQAVERERRAWHLRVNGCGDTPAVD
eukprot:gene20320-27077_t